MGEQQPAFMELEPSSHFKTSDFSCKICRHLCFKYIWVNSENHFSVVVISCYSRVSTALCSNSYWDSTFHWEESAIVTILWSLLFYQLVLQLCGARLMLSTTCLFLLK